MSKQQFVKDLLKGTDFNVINSVGMIKLPNNRVAKLEIRTSGTSGRYDQLKLSVINKEDGVVDTCFFKFSEHLEADKKVSHQNATYKSENLKVVEHCGWEWYIDRPTKESIAKLKIAINDYLLFLV